MNRTHKRNLMLVAVLAYFVIATFTGMVLKNELLGATVLFFSWATWCGVFATRNAETGCRQIPASAADLILFFREEQLDLLLPKHETTASLEQDPHFLASLCTQYALFCTSELHPIPDGIGPAPRNMR